jgi:putative autoinducer-2 (AI-2) aldolase
LIIAGGKKTSEREAIELAAKAMRAGASGVDMGRNVFQSDCPVGMIRAVRAVVHDGATVDAAFAVYQQEKSKGT